MADTTRARKPRLRLTCTLLTLLCACGDTSATTDTDAPASTGSDTGAEASATGTSATTAVTDAAGTDGGSAGATTSASETTSGATSSGSTAAVSDSDSDSDSDSGDDPPASKCVESATEIACPKETLELEIAPLITREVHWQVPNGAPPASGWPIAIMFQGSLFTSELTWLGTIDGPFGMYYQVLTLKRLLDAGYAVLTPEAHAEGSTFWDTNVPPFSTNWELSPDHDFMLAIFDAIEQGAFGPLDLDTMYATGISSGGYMTSRMAVSYPGMFSALAVHSASYATCSGPVCLVPELDDQHPPTLLLMGGDDPIVPLFTAETYRDRLVEAGVENELVVDAQASHEWIPAAPDAVLAWFESHPPP